MTGAVPDEPDGWADLVFVFGGNTAGRHGAGAAAAARRHYGAIEGVGEGRQGNAYAIPTKNDDLDSLSFNAIVGGVDRFIDHALSNPDTHFQITRVGCGLAGFTDDQIRPIFLNRELPPNCHLPGIWHKYLDPGIVRLIVAGGRDFGRLSDHRDMLENDLARARHRFNDVATIEVVSGMAKGADTLGLSWAQRRPDATVARFAAQWRRHGRAAGFVRNQAMAWYGTHLLAYWDRTSPGTKNMIQAGQQQGLPTWVRHY